MDKTKIILLVSDEVYVGTLVTILKESLSNVEVIHTNNVIKASGFLADKSLDIQVCIVDLNVSSMLFKILDNMSISSLLIVNEMNKKAYTNLEKYTFSDYVSTASHDYLNQILSGVSRILKNYTANILIVDDSKVQLQVAVLILENQNLSVHTASNGEEALNMIKKGDIKFSLVLTDYNMPVMDGLELTFALRKLYAKDELGIIALSGSDSVDVIAKFLKMGANDFITKPYSDIEVTTRINSNLETLDLFEASRNLANRDYMTGAYNRRFFFESGNAIFHKAQRSNRDLCVAMFDIDKFKNINDTYGHDVGDEAIKEIVKILDVNLRTSDLMARFGGEEFCVLLEEISLEDVKILFEKIRISFEENILKTAGLEIKFTVSIGVKYGLGKDLEEMIKHSDDGLYFCKNNGRNQVAINVEPLND
ncbi:diguanylate cyclase [Sulfurimonas sp. SAG-AH-194-I05]|nr:diguanylate cyclase [Sulfurimonas sp. SAG-AH-194-I05]MDF1874214.1 diguanylate cyclase [Sulfurimonas sp. SAG-AH-194-I05]